MLLIIFLIVMLIRVVKLFFGVDFYGSIFGVPFLFISTHVGLTDDPGVCQTHLAERPPTAIPAENFEGLNWDQKVQCIICLSNK